MGCAFSKRRKKGFDDDDQLRMLTNFTQEELQKAHDDFIKESPSGQMNRKQFEEFYPKVFCHDKNMKFVDHLFRTFDFNNDGQINFKEFVCALSVTTRGTPEEKLTWTFNVYDVNHDGTITHEEMKEIMRAIYAINGVSEPEQIKYGDEAFETLDTNHDGLISVAEFVKGVKNDKRLLEMLDQTVNTNNSPSK